MGKLKLINTNTSFDKKDTMISFYGGVNEIGGNKIMVSDKDINLFLDFGKSFANEKLYYDDPYIAPRTEEHLLGLELLPRFNGLYKNTSDVCGLDAVILSHAHLDHSDSIRFLKDCYPIYCGETTENIIKANEISGRVADSDHRLSNKNFKSFRTGKMLNFDNIKIEPIHVEHSVPGSYGLLLETNNGNIGYTGDFRMRGSKMSINNNKNMTKDFITKAREYDLDTLIIEATNIDDFRIESEEEIIYKMGKICENTKGLIMAGVNKNDIDRLRSFYTVASSQGRSLAISSKQAYLLYMLKNDKNLDIFRVDDPNIRIFMRNKKTEAKYEGFLKKNFSNNILYAEDVHNIQKELIMIASLYDMNELIEIRPIADSIYLLSTSEPFDEEGELRHEKLKMWLDKYGIPMCQAHVSGHATAQELKNVIKEIKPKTVVPVHTCHPELFKKFMKDVDVNVELPVNFAQHLCQI